MWRGGSGKIFTVKVDKQILENIDEVGKFVSEVFSKVCEEVAVNVSSTSTIQTVGCNYFNVLECH